jgi:predicted CoA-binding protein
MILTMPSQRRALLERVRTIAMVGASPNPLRPSYTVFSYLRRQPEFEVMPINPTIEEIDGVRAFPSLAAYSEERGAPDLVDVFRRPSEAIAVVNDAIAVRAKAIWFQYGVINDEAIALADASGIDVVVDRCMKVEHARFRGGLSMSGLNSGLITSRRRPI